LTLSGLITTQTQLSWICNIGIQSFIPMRRFIEMVTFKFSRKCIFFPEKNHTLGNMNLAFVLGTVLSGMLQLGM